MLSTNFMMVQGKEQKKNQTILRQTSQLEVLSSHG